MNSLLISQADARHIPLPDQSVHMVCFSPPYWGLRDYGVDGQLGLEATPDEYIANMMLVMDEMWRVLRDDGTCWANLADSYIGGGNYRGMNEATLTDKQRSNRGSHGQLAIGRNGAQPSLRVKNIPSKNLALIPQRFALAVQERGWIVRQDIIWSKPNPMPESVTDRPTTAHEHVFLLSKQGKYFYDADSIRNKSVYPNDNRKARASITHKRNKSTEASAVQPGDSTYPTRNARSVWTIATQPYAGAHYATWPEKLVERMVKAGTSERGVCAVCGAQWERVVEREPMEIKRTDWGARAGNRTASSGTMVKPPSVTTIGWSPTCDHDHKPVPAIVLDPFAGSGTTGLVARKLRRRAILFDLSFAYLNEQAMERTGEKALREWRRGGKRIKQTADLGPLFEGIV